jgi:chitinase
MNLNSYLGPPSDTTMAQSVEAALKAAEGQLAALYPAYGIHLAAQQIWQRLGATVMIGQNDFQGQIFTVADARTVAGFAVANHLGRVSVNRDSQCGASYSQTGLLSNTCSGTPQ